MQANGANRCRATGDQENSGNDVSQGGCSALLDLVAGEIKLVFEEKNKVCCFFCPKIVQFLAATIIKNVLQRITTKLKV